MADIFIGGDPYTDPEAENATDGSVDYYDFSWGDPVQYDESEMEPNVINCDSACTSSTACGNNTPEQTDEEAYDVIDV